MRKLLVIVLTVLALWVMAGTALAESGGIIPSGTFSTTDTK